MLTETGRVVAVERDGIWVETIRQSTCGSCAARQGCGHRLLNRLGDGKQGYIRVLPGRVSPAECEINDQVRIGIPGEVILRGSLVVYLLPLLTLLLGAGSAVALFPGQTSGADDGVAVLGATFGLALGIALVRWHAWRHRHDRRLQPTLLERLPPRPTPS